MPDSAHCDVELSGCSPEPLMAYLKALGILRLVSEQKDSDARGWWNNDVFWLRSRVLFAEGDPDNGKKAALADFFLTEYEPTPIVGPWAGGSGFFKKDNNAAVEALSASKAARIDRFAKAIRSVHAILKEEGVGDKPTDVEKARLIRRYRRELPDQVVAWMDAAMVLQRDRQGFAPVLGTGGNDGRLDFTRNFMQRIVGVGLHETAAASDQSRSWLRQALFDESTKLVSAGVGQFAPGRVGGPNATQGMEGGATVNPWDFILMLEGVVMLGGAAVRRLAAGEGRTAFPFTVRTVAAGFDSSASSDQATSRGELWLPLWSRPASFAELGHLFAEGRADISSRLAKDGTDFARAVASLGVDRGVTGFTRLGFLKRSGKNYLATPLGRFAVTERREVDLLREIDNWLGRFRRACSANDAPARFSRGLRAVDSAVLDFCTFGGRSLFQKILVAIGRAERELANAERFREKQRINPIPALSCDWLDATNDASAEFAFALGLASVYDREDKVGPLRANLEAVDWKKNCRAWTERGSAVVWNAADLPANLASVLERRLMDGERNGCIGLPLASRFAVPLDVVAAFVDGALDDGRIEDLIWGLVLVDPRRRGGRESIKPGWVSSPLPAPLPRDYALLKLLFLPRPIVPEQVGAQVRWRLARESESGITVRPEPRILSLLRAGRVGDACRIAA